MSEQRVLQPFAVMAPPQDPSVVEDPDADRFIEDTTVVSGLSWQEWLAHNRPHPPVPVAEAGLPEDDIPDAG